MTSKAEVIKRPVEQVGDTIKKSAWGAVIGSLVTMLLGILLVVWPDATLSIATNIFGAFLIINGIFQIITYFVVNGQRDFFNNGLLIGVISLLIGVTTIMIGSEIAGIFRIVIGIWLIYEALGRVNTAIKLCSFGIKTWGTILFLAILMLAVGIFVIFNTGAVITLIGWMMILSGAIGIIGDTMFIQQVNTVVDNLTKQ